MSRESRTFAKLRECGQTAHAAASAGCGVRCCGSATFDSFVTSPIYSSSNTALKRGSRFGYGPKRAGDGARPAARANRTQRGAVGANQGLAPAGSRPLPRSESSPTGEKKGGTAGQAPVPLVDGFFCTRCAARHEPPPIMTALEGRHAAPRRFSGGHTGHGAPHRERAPRPRRSTHPAPRSGRADRARATRPRTCLASLRRAADRRGRTHRPPGHPAAPPAHRRPQEKQQ